jgi:hypothetical protein
MPTVIDGDTGVSQVQNGVIVQADLASGVAGTGPAFGAYQGTAQTFANAVYTKVIFDVEEFDTNNNFASSSFTPTVAGYYTITARVDLSPTAEVLPVLYKNGVAFKRFTYNTSPSGGTQWGGTVSCIYMNGTTDYLEFYCYQSSGGTSKNSSAAQAVTYFNGAMVRAA